MVARGIDEGEHRVAEGGAPVFAIADDAELAALSALAATFGAELVHDAGHIAAEDPGPEHVLAVGDEAMVAARLYARLTGRHVTRVDAIEDHVGVRPAMVIGAPSAFHPGALASLYDPRADGPAPGILWGRGEVELLRRVKLAAAAAVLRAPAVNEVTFVNPDAPMAMRREGTRTMSGSLTPKPALRELFTSNRGVLAIATHSDGVDGGLGGHILCPMDRPRGDADLARAPRCATTGECHRLRRPVAEVIGSDDVVHPDALAMPILVWGACFGVMAPDGPVDPAWGVLDRLLANPKIGVIVTAWEASFVLPPLVLALVSALEAGLTIGEAVGQLNRSPAAVARRFRLCVVGDPRVRATLRASVPLAGPAAPAVRPLESRDDDLEQLAFLRYLLTITRPPEQVPAALVEGWQRSRSAVQDAEVAWLQGRGQQAEAALHRAVIDDLAQRGPLTYHGWIRSAHVDAESDAPVCPACRNANHRVTRYRASFRGGAVPARRVSFCPSCSVIEDAPIDNDLALGRHDGAFELSGTRPHERWSAALVIVEQGQVGRQVHRWPADENGRPVARFEPAEALPPGPFDAVLVLMHRTRLVLAVQKTRAALEIVSPQAEDRRIKSPT